MVGLLIQGDAPSGATGVFAFPANAGEPTRVGRHEHGVGDRFRHCSPQFSSPEFLGQIGPRSAEVLCSAASDRCEPLCKTTLL